MLYVCSCGFTAATATAFYKHLATSKESGGGHQLTQARFSDNPDKADVKRDVGPEAMGTASWVEEYLMVDQRDTAAQGSLPVSSAPPAAAAVPGHVPQQTPLPSTTGGLDDVPLRDLQGMSRGWGGLGRSRGSVIGRPPLPIARASAAVAAEAPEPTLDSDEVEVLEHTRDHRASNAASSRGGGGSGGTTAQAALRVSGSVVSAVVVGLSPWRWFGNGACSAPDVEAVCEGPGTAVGLGSRADPLGAPQGVDVADGGAGVEATGEVVGPSAAAGAVLLQRQAYPYPYVPGSPAGSLEAVHAVRDVLIWRNPWRTSRVFCAGLYSAVCVRQLAKGHEMLQPSTAIFAVCFLLLLRNVVREAAANYRRNQQQQQQQQQLQEEEEDRGKAEATACDVVMTERMVCSSPGLSPRDAAEVERRKAARQLQLRIESVLQRVALGAARFGAALLVLGVGLLSGRRAITSALVAALLWLGMVIGELRLISQPTFWLLCYVAAFTVPAVYCRCRPAMDAAVETALRFVAQVLLSGSRTALAVAASVGGVLLVALPLNFVLRASLATAAAFGVLLWQSTRELGGVGGPGEQRAAYGYARLTGAGAQGWVSGGLLEVTGQQRREHEE